MEKKKILIADDNQGMLIVLSEMLEHAGYEVETINNGNTLLTRGNNWPDLIILDIFLGNQDGRDICFSLKHQKSTQNIPIIIFSSSHQLKKSALMAGANDFLPKPFQVNDLLEKVEMWINKYEKDKV